MCVCICDVRVSGVRGVYERWGGTLTLSKGTRSLDNPDPIRPLSDFSPLPLKHKCVMLDNEGIRHAS